MELYQSNVVLVKEKVTENPEVWKYMLYSVTMMDHSHYVAEDFDQTTYTLNTDGDYDVTLKVTKDTTIPIDMDYLKPVIHIADLDGLTLSETNPTIAVTVKEGGQTVGRKRKLHKSSADENAKPI